jgi:hypothetical protein
MLRNRYDWIVRFLFLVLAVAGSVAAQPSDARWSPDEKRYAIAAKGESVGKGEERERLIVYSQDGKELTIAHIWLEEPDGTGRVGIRGCENWGWIDNSKLFCQGSHNPSLGIYLVFDASTGRELYELLGSEFVWSPNGKYVANSGNVPHFSDWETKSNSLDLGGKQVYPADRDPDIHRFRSELTWSPDSRYLALVDQRKKQDAIFLVMVTMNGTIIEHKLRWQEPVGDFPAETDFAVQWEPERVSVEHMREVQTFSITSPARK